MASIPGVLHLHHARLSAGDVQAVDAVRVTTPLRTLSDDIAKDVVASELHIQGIDQALERGLFVRRQLEASRVTTRTRHTVDRVLKQVL